jgi:5,10-methylenetetrahydrofolate reductase
MNLKSKLEAGEFTILAEIEPPKGVDVSGMLAGAIKVKGLVDAFIVPEMSNAVMRMSALGASMILQEKGLETVMQICCRDRNRLALQADLLAADACGIHNVMAISGEDPSYGDHHQTRSVYDIDLMALLRVATTLQSGKDMAGIDLFGAPRFLMGATMDAGAQGKPPERVLEEMDQKREAGAQFFISPPLFDPKAIEPLLKRLDLHEVRIIPTVLLLKSVGMARYISSNLKHIHIPESLIERIRKSKNKEQTCIRIASEMVTTLKHRGFSGALLSTMGWEDKLPEIIRQTRGD